MNTAHLKVTQNISGVGPIKKPVVGMLWIWTFWIFGAGFGLAFARPWSAGGIKAVPLIVTTGIAAGLMLSYPTVAFRYRIDLWPFVMTICLLSVPGLLSRFGNEIQGNPRIPFYSLLVMTIGVLASITTMVIYNYGAYLTHRDGQYKAWDAATCIEMLSPKEFSMTYKEALCIDPHTLFDERVED